jgi:hypothetical protein
MYIKPRVHVYVHTDTHTHTHTRVKGAANRLWRILDCCFDARGWI